MKGYDIEVKVLVGINAESDVGAVEQISTIHKEIDAVLKDYKEKRPVRIKELVVSELKTK